jgi:hypothetical protein
MPRSPRPPPKAQIAESGARTAARPVVAAKVAESKTLGARTQARLVESIVGRCRSSTARSPTRRSPPPSSPPSRPPRPRSPTTSGPPATSLFGSFGSVAESAAGGEQLNEADVLASIRKPFGQKTGA